jgi:voltage-gated potassium channel
MARRGPGRSGAGSAEHTAVAERRTPLARLVERHAGRAFTARVALRLIVAFTATTTVAGGVFMWIFDHRDFPTVWQGLWWALQTVTTVGYGDVVPSPGGGRAVASVVMLSGIAFLTLATATITATLVEAARRRLTAAGGDPVADELARLRAEVEALREELRGRTAPPAEEPGPPPDAGPTST